MTAPQTEGLIPRLWYRAFGRRMKWLSEQHRPTSWMAYVLMCAQSAALVLVFGHTELQWIEQRNPALLIIVGLSLFLLVATAIAAQNCAITCIQRVGILLRNGAYGAALEHTLYIVFVELVEIFTLGLAIYILETNPHLLLSDAPIIPFGAIGLLVTIGLRVAIIGWTEIQLQIVRQPLPPGWETFMEESKAIIGGHGRSILQGMELTNTDLASVALAYAESVKPPVRRKTWWNGPLIRRDEEYRAALDEQAKRIADQLEVMSGNRLAEVERDYQQRIQQLTAEKNDLIARANQQINAAKESVKAQAIEWTSRALTALSLGGSLPQWLLEARPELADITLTKRAVSARKGGNNTAANMPKSPADAMRFFLASFDIIPAKAPNNKRGIWIKSSDIARLIGEHSLPEPATKLAERLGKAAMKGETSPRDGTAYIARLDDVMPALIAYHCVEDSVLNAWAMVPQSGGDSGDNGAVIPFDSRRQA